MSRIVDWALAFAVTLAVELLVAVPLLGPPASRGRRAVAVTLGQLLTHPAVWFVFPQLGLSRMAYLLLAEAWAVLGELCWYRLAFRSTGWSRLLAVSALANGCSLAAGTLLW